MTIAHRRAIPTNLNSWKEKQLERKIIHFHSRQILEFNSCKKRMFCTYQLHVKQVHRRFWISILRLLSLKREIWPNFFDLSFSAYVVPRRRKQKSENKKIYTKIIWGIWQQSWPLAQRNPSNAQLYVVFIPLKCHRVLSNQRKTMILKSHPHKNVPPWLQN